MTHYRKRYLDELARIQDRVEALFEEVLLRPSASEGTSPAPGGAASFPGGAPSGNPPGVWAPAVDVVEEGGELLLYAELPGVERDDVELTVDGRRLELSGRRLPLPADRVFARMERSYGPFRRVFELPAEVDADAVSASFRHGVLRVALPKRRSAGSRGAVPIDTPETPDTPGGA